jgi:hypothetical protein
MFIRFDEVKYVTALRFAIFQVVTAVLITIQIFWVVTPCLLANIYRRFEWS